jgi:hypothetical protein
MRSGLFLEIMNIKIKDFSLKTSRKMPLGDQTQIQDSIQVRLLRTKGKMFPVPVSLSTTPSRLMWE